MNKKIAVIAGDGIGPEIVTEAVKVLTRIEETFDHHFEYDFLPAGGSAIDQTGIPLPAETLQHCKESDSVLLGAVGGPRWDGLEKHLRPERALLELRSALGLYANIRPVKLMNALKEASPLKSTILDKGLDLVVVRELIGGLYFGDRKTFINAQGETEAQDLLVYTESEIRRIAESAFRLAMQRRKVVTSVDKANVLDASRLWRKIMHQVKEKYPEVKYNDMLVDNCAMQLIHDPSQFDVIVTENMFGDILSDEASMLTGSIGMIPSMSTGADGPGLYEPIHGSAPDIAGQNIANPVATILSAAMMLRYAFDMPRESQIIETAVEKVLGKGFATSDIHIEGKTLVSCSHMGDLICEEITVLGRA